MKKIFNFLILVSLPLISFSQTASEIGLTAINEGVVEAQLEFLASDWTEGRATGSRGAYMAADYIASMFKLYGLEPGGDLEVQRFSRREVQQGKKNKSFRSYFQNFPLIEYFPEEDQSLSLIKRVTNSVSETHFSYQTDFDVSPGPISQSGRGEILFVGYGLKDEGKKYDDFDKIDAKGKVILRISGYPGHKDSSSPSHEKFKPKDRLQEWQMNNKKNEDAAGSGAIAILEADFRGAAYKAWSKNIPFRFNTEMYEGDERPKAYYDTRMTLPGDSLDAGPPVFTISPRIANQLLELVGINLEEFEKEMAREARPQSRVLKNTEISFKTGVNSKIIYARNVIGVLKGKDTTEMIVVGGHYDHVGKYNGYIWNGADDNASGTVGVMSIAKACMETGERPEKTIVFAAWTGEEKGLWGSKFFVEHPYDKLKMVLNLNYDMISRDNADDISGNECSMSYTESYPLIEKITKESIEEFNINLNVKFRPSSSARGGSDHAPFAAKGIPYFYFMAGFPPEYHQPDDHIELVNIPKMTNIIRIGFLNVWRFSNSQDWRNDTAE